MVPDVRVEEVIDSVEAATAIEVEVDWLCAGLLLSVTLTVMFEVPTVVGVPETIPFEASVKPAGSVPAVTAQV